MKVLLVQAYLGGNEPLVFPIGLACIAANLGDHEVRACDTNLADDAFAELTGSLDDFRPDVVGISLRNIDSTNKRKVVFYYAYLRDLLDVVKEHSAAKVVIGGSGFSMYAQEIMETEQRIDLGVYLEGEAVFPALLGSLDNPEAVDSIFYRKDGRVVFSGPCKSQINLNTIPLPNRKLFRLNAYRSIVPDAIGIETKRGCSLSCIYCIYGFLNGKKMRLREPKRIVDEMDALVKEYGIERFTFVDSVFNLPHRHAEAVCKELIDRRIKVKWSAWFNERFTTRELLELAVKAGCTNAIFSPDGFSDETLKKLGKDLSQADIMRVYRMLPDVEGVEIQSFTLDWTQEAYGIDSMSSQHMVIGWSGGNLHHDPGGSWTHTYDLSGLAVGNHFTLTHTKDWSDMDCQRITQTVTPTSNALVIVGFDP